MRLHNILDQEFQAAVTNLSENKISVLSVIMVLFIIKNKTKPILGIESVE